MINVKTWNDAVKARRFTIDVCGIDAWRDAAEEVANERHLKEEYTLSAWWLTHATMKDEMKAMNIAMKAWEAKERKRCGWDDRARIIPLTIVEKHYGKEAARQMALDVVSKKEETK